MLNPPQLAYWARAYEIRVGIYLCARELYQRKTTCNVERSLWRLPVNIERLIKKPIHALWSNMLNWFGRRELYNWTL